MKFHLKTSLKRLPCLLAAGLAFALLPHAAQAQTNDHYPNKPFRLLVGFAPGGSNDIIARLLAPKLGEALGQQVIIENRPGAGGNIAVDAMLRAPRDGYTMLMCATGTLSIQPFLSKSTSFNPETDIIPVTQVVNAPLLLLVNSALPVHSVKELVEYARANPGKINFASSGNGTGGHMAGEMLKSRANIDIVHVAYKGTGQAMTDVIGGQVSMIFDQPVSSMAYVKSGKLRALALASPRRLPGLPDIPTVSESGIPDFDPVGWSAICAGKGTPTYAIDRIQREIAKVMAQPDIAQRFVQDGLEAVANTPEQFRAFLATDKRKWGALVKSANIKLE